MLGSTIRRLAKGLRSNWKIISPARPECDLREKAEVEDLFNDHRFDLVIHSAAKVGGIQANINDPVGFLTENVSMNMNVIETAFNAGVKDLIFLGSSCMYPRDLQRPLREGDLLTAPLEPTNEGYALSKIVGAKLCEYLSRMYGVNYRTLIPCNLFGPGDAFDENRSHLIAAAIEKVHRAVKDGCEQVVIWGDGTARREFLFVEDLSEFIIQVSDHLDKVDAFLNVGYGSDFSVNDYYRFVADAMDYHGQFIHDLTRPVGMKYKLMDSSKANRLGWLPKTKMPEGIESTVNHYLGFTQK